jgi:hypothetical protein
LAYLNNVVEELLSHNVVVMNTAAIAAYQEDAGFFHMPCRDRSIVLFLKGTVRLYKQPAKPKAAMTQKNLEEVYQESVGEGPDGTELESGLPQVEGGHVRADGILGHGEAL